ncbi:MAG TPA: co-chaperone GroES [Candidatus Paceibacterota bacterium]|nr:co-chaperone GroES [Candidatus Paceibacterota bacterium]
MAEKSPITPLGDKVVIRPLSEDESGTKSASGIIIPDSVESKDKSDQGVVVAIGPGAWDEDGEKRIPLDVKEGDRVLFSSWREKVKVGEDEYFVISQSDIHGTINS